MKSIASGPGLQVRIVANYQALSRTVAALIANSLKRRPQLLLCASAGGTPTGAYDRLATLAATSPRRFARLRILQIDEWAGLPTGHPASCAADLHVKLVKPLRLAPSRYTGFNTAAADLPAECRRVARWLDRHGPIDLCILGLGRNGHIAMNEPTECALPGVHVARLALSSQNHPMLQGLKTKPSAGLTLGLGDILRARKILLLVSGSHKRQALQRLLRHQVTTRFPASFLWLHPDVTILCDRSAVTLRHRNLRRQVTKPSRTA